MIDEGSSAEVMFLDAFRQLKLDDNHIKPSRAPLTGFEGTETWPMGEITLLVTIADKTVEIDFVVVDRPSSYNAILGRDWMHKMEAEASSRYQVVKFPSRSGDSIISVRGDQLLSKKLYAMEIKKKSSVPREEQEMQA